MGLKTFCDVGSYTIHHVFMTMCSSIARISCFTRVAKINLRLCLIGDSSCKIHVQIDKIIRKYVFAVL